MPTIMKSFFVVVLALHIIITTEEELELSKEKRSINHFYTSPLHSFNLNDLNQYDLLNQNSHWQYSLNSIFPAYSPFVPQSFSTYFQEPAFSPGYTLIHNLRKPFAARFNPPVSIPQVVTPKSPPQVKVASTERPLPATSYGVPQPYSAPILPPSPPIPAPVHPPSQIGRLGSGSLGYVHLGNGLYALGSGSLGYTPPAKPIQPPQPTIYGPPTYSKQNYNNYL